MQVSFVTLILVSILYFSRQCQHCQFYHTLIDVTFVASEICYIDEHPTSSLIAKSSDAVRVTVHIKAMMERGVRQRSRLKCLGSLKFSSCGEAMYSFKPDFKLYRGAVKLEAEFQMSCILFFSGLLLLCCLPIIVCGLS